MLKNFKRLKSNSTLIYRFKPIPIKSPAGIFVEIDNPILKFISKWPRKAKAVFKKNKVARLTISDFKNYYEAIVHFVSGLQKN